MTFQTGSMHDRGAAGSQFASAEEAVARQTTTEILRLLRHSATPSLFIATLRY
ncbi:hypothetical protein Scep_024964 [Stephania cephalantha]|uniref:Uncharacterized protein n=1 Tax=Stephania cephalantha TaxID=152367 RepID=A0AAP0HZ37_9MAGN